MLPRFKNVLSEIHVLLTRDREHGRVFGRIPIVDFSRTKRLKDILGRVKVGPLEKKKGSCRLSGGARCEIMQTCYGH